MFMRRIVNTLPHADQIEIPVESLKPKGSKYSTATSDILKQKSCYCGCYLVTKELEEKASVIDFLLSMSKPFGHA